MEEEALKQEMWDRIRAHGAGSVCSATDFADLAEYSRIAHIMSDYEAQGRIVRLFPGEAFFCYTGRNARDTVYANNAAAAIIRAKGWTCRRSDKKNDTEYLSSGPDCVFDNGQLTVRFVHREAADLAQA